MADYSIWDPESPKLSAFNAITNNLFLLQTTDADRTKRYDGSSTTNLRHDTTSNTTNLRYDTSTNLPTSLPSLTSKKFKMLRLKKDATGEMGIVISKKRHAERGTTGYIIAHIEKGGLVER